MARAKSFCVRSRSDDHTQSVSARSGRAVRQLRAGQFVNVIDLWSVIVNAAQTTMTFTKEQSVTFRPVLYLFNFLLIVLMIPHCGGQPTATSDAALEEGTEGGKCYGNGTCNKGLVCASQICVRPPWAADGNLSDDAGIVRNDSTVPITDVSVIPTDGSVPADAAPPLPIITSVAPSSIPAKSTATLITVKGTGFVAASIVQADGAALVTLYVDESTLTATIPAAALLTTKTISITVKNPSGTSAAATVSVISNTISIAPTAVSLATGAKQQFTATVNGPANKAVTWSIDGAGSGNATKGNVSAAGLYTAPALVPTPAAVTVRATSVGAPAESATALVTIVSAGEDWPKYRRDLSNTGRSLETSISSANVTQLKQKWAFPTGSSISASPAVATVNGKLTAYVGSWNGIFFAVDAITGQKRWSYDTDDVGVTCNATTKNPRCWIASSAAVDNGKVFFGAHNGYFYALNADTGALAWKAQLGDPATGAAVWSSPAVYNNVVYIGVASFQSEPCIAGKIFAFNATTGAPVWTLDTIDQSTCPSGTCLGAGIWSSPAIDTQFNTLYVGTGNAGKGCAPATANATKYPDGVIAVALADGKVKSFFQTKPNSLYDEADVGATPSLTQTSVVDECKKTSQISYWLTVPSKDSFAWVWQRGANGLVAPATSIVSLASEDTVTGPAVIPFSTSKACGTGSTQIVESGNEIIVPSKGGNLFSLKQIAAGTASINWKLALHACPSNNPCPLFSPPTAITDLIFLGGGDGNFYAINSKGQKVWTFGTNGLVASSPAISRGRIYVGSYDGSLYCISINGQ